MPKITKLCLNLSKLCLEYCALFFPDMQEFLKWANNKKLSYRRETARQLPTPGVDRPSSPLSLLPLEYYALFFPDTVHLR